MMYYKVTVLVSFCTVMYFESLFTANQSRPTVANKDFYTSYSYSYWTQ